MERYLNDTFSYFRVLSQHLNIRACQSFFFYLALSSEHGVKVHVYFIQRSEWTSRSCPVEDGLVPAVIDNLKVSATTSHPLSNLHLRSIDLSVGGSLAISVT